MENMVIIQVIHEIEESMQTLTKYARFVNDLEFLAEQNPDVFDSAERRNGYMHLWSELEILNACALSEWEETGKGDFHNIWAKKYYDDAKALGEELTAFLWRCLIDHF